MDIKPRTDADPFFYIDYEKIHLLGGEANGLTIPVHRGVERVHLPVAVGQDWTGYMHGVTYRRLDGTSIFVRQDER